MKRKSLRLGKVNFFCLSEVRGFRVIHEDLRNPVFICKLPKIWHKVFWMQMVSFYVVGFWKIWTLFGFNHIFNACGSGFKNIENVIKISTYLTVKRITFRRHVSQIHCILGEWSLKSTFQLLNTRFLQRKKASIDLLNSVRISSVKPWKLRVFLQEISQIKDCAKIKENHKILLNFPVWYSNRTQSSFFCYRFHSLHQF